MSGIGGYVRRGDRKYIKPDSEFPDDGTIRCSYCRARIYMYPHFCKEITYGTAIFLTPMIPIGDQ